MDHYINSRIVFLKTLILNFNEEFNSEVYDVISENEMGASKFSWLVWNNKNQSTNISSYYIPYNTQLLTIEEKVKENKKVSFIKEKYHPRILSQVLLKRHFGIWSENDGLEIFEKDFYKRRIDMNGTELTLLFNAVKNKKSWRLMIIQNNYFKFL